MPFSFPSSPSVGATSTQNGRSYTYAGNNVWELTPATGGGGSSGVVILPGLGDPLYSSVSMLLHGDGANGSTTITDNSGSPKTFTISGSAAVSTARAKFGSGSLLLGSSTTVTSNSSSDFAFGTGDFTVEFWMNAATLPTSETRLVNFGSDGGDKYLNLVYGYSGNTFSIVNEVVAHVLTTSQAVSLNQWHHVAYTRSAGTLYLFFNGALLGSTSASGVNTPSTTIQLTAGNGSIYYDDFRVTRAARYTARFFPSIVAFHNSENLIAFVESGIPAAPTNLTASAGNTQASLSWTAPLAAYPITDYVVQFSSNDGATWTTFTPPTPVITISSQPSNQTASGGSATFSVTASLNVAGSLSYLWQRSDDGGSSWANVSGATSSSLALSSLTNGSDNSDQYRVIVSSTGATSVTSSAATLTVGAASTPAYIATGASDSSYNGTYALAGTSNGANYYRITGQSRYLYWTNAYGMETWMISATLGLDFAGDFNGYQSDGGSGSVPLTFWNPYGSFYPGSGPTLTSTTV